jgi:hypothetical protein
MKVEAAFAYINCAPCIYVYFSPHLPDGYAIRYDKNPLQKAYGSSFIMIEPKQKCSEKNFEDIIKAIDNQIFVVAATDVFYLPYKQHYFNRYHASHAIIIYGYDNEQNCIHIIDYYDKDSFIGVISYDDFWKSWSSSNPSEANPFSGSPINNVWGFLKMKKEKERESSILIRENLTNAATFFHGRNGKRCFIGIDGLNRLRSLIQRHISEGYKINLERLHKNLYMYYREKVLLQDYIDCYVDKIKSSELILSSLEKNILSWNVFLTYFLKICTLNRNISLEKFNCFFDDILHSENNLCDDIIYLLK